MELLLSLCDSSLFINEDFASFKALFLRFLELAYSSSLLLFVESIGFCCDLNISVFRLKLDTFLHFAKGLIILINLP